MRIITIVLTLMAAAALGTGCVHSPTGPGFLYMNVKGPLGPADGKSTAKMGEACARTYLAIVSTGDASLETAKRTAGITTVTTMDHHSTNVLGFGKFCTVVYGQ